MVWLPGAKMAVKWDLAGSVLVGIGTARNSVAEATLA
jgi:hypothetical protein